jgi:hypothetical protein
VEKKWIRRFGLFGTSLLISSVLVVGAQELAAPAATVQGIEVSFDVAIESGNLNAARDKSKAVAFEKAMSASLPQELPSTLREQRIKSASRFVKSFQMIEEKNAGDFLSFRYQVEFYPAAFEGLKGDLGPTLESKDWNVEIVTDRALNAGQVIEQLERAVGLKVTSFKLTRSALILELKSHKTKDSLKEDVQSVVGAMGSVAVFEKLPLTIPQDALQQEGSGPDSSQGPVEPLKDELEKD